MYAQPYRMSEPMDVHESSEIFVADRGVMTSPDRRCWMGL